MTTKLVVADPERSENTICLAVTPAMKALGIQNRCRIKDIPKYIDYIVAQPRMRSMRSMILKQKLKRPAPEVQAQMRTPQRPIS